MATDEVLSDKIIVKQCCIFYIAFANIRNIKNKNN